MAWLLNSSGDDNLAFSSKRFDLLVIQVIVPGVQEQQSEDRQQVCKHNAFCYILSV